MPPEIHLLDEVGSTNDLALTSAREGAAHGEAWLADAQTAGRGRREIGGDRRAWHSPKGSNVYLSVVVRPDVAAEDVPNITLAAGAFVVDALARRTGLDLWLKWPNDILVGRRKIAGLLTEGVVDQNGFQAAVVGIGVNVNLSDDEVPAELAEIMTSLQIESGHPNDRMSLALEVRQAIVDAADSLAADGLAGSRELVEKYDASDGVAVEIDAGDGPLEGIARGITPDGALRVEVDGEVRELRTGEARLRA